VLAASIINALPDYMAQQPRRQPSSIIIKFNQNSISEPNDVAEWMAILHHIRVVPSSNLGLETSYPDRDFSWFPSVPPTTTIQSVVSQLAGQTHTPYYIFILCAL
jgi:hypothetical protein